MSSYARTVNRAHPREHEGMWHRVLHERRAIRLYERGLVVKPRVLRRDGACLREVSPAGMDAGGAPAGWLVAKPRGRGWGGGLERCSCLYRFINFEDWVLSGLAPVAHVKNGLSGSQ